MKFLDDLTVAVAIDLKRDLIPDQTERQRPLAYDEKDKLVLPKEKNILQKSLNELSEFIDENSMKINVGKTKVMMFNMSKKLRFPLEVSLYSSDFLEINQSSKILGIIIENNLKWSKNTQFITEKCRSRIWTLRRLKKLGFSVDFIVEVYTKEIRPILEYCAPVWSGGLTKSDSLKIERIQKSVFRLVLGDAFTSYSSACETLKLEQLYIRREKLCLKFATKEFHKESHGIFQGSTSRNPRKVSQMLVKKPSARTRRFTSNPMYYLSEVLNKMGRK